MQHESVEEGSDLRSRAGLDIRRVTASRLRLSGELDLASAGALAEALTPMTRPAAVVEIDVAGLTFIGAAGANVICAAARELGDCGRLVLVAPTPSVRRMIDVTGVGSMIGDPRRRASTRRRRHRS